MDPQIDTAASTHSDEEEHAGSPKDAYVSPPATPEKSAPSAISTAPAMDPQMDAVAPTHPNEEDETPPFDATPKERDISPSTGENSAPNTSLVDATIASATLSQPVEENDSQQSSQSKSVTSEANATSESPRRVLASTTNLNNPSSSPIRPPKRKQVFVHDSEGESEVEEKDSDDEEEVPVRFVNSLFHSSSHLANDIPRPPPKKRQRVDSSTKRGTRTKAKTNNIKTHPLYEQYISSLLPLAKGRTGLSLEGRRNRLCEDPLVRKITDDGRVITCDACSEDLVLAGACSFCRWRDHRAICPKGIEWFVARSAGENEKPT